MPDTQSKILVTGGTGLVGSHLINALVNDGKHVVAIYRNDIPANDYNGKVDWVKCSLEDVVELNEVMQQVHQVYHCAAVVSFNPKHYAHMLRVNVEGTANIVNAAIANQISKLCYVSSVAALGRIRKGEEVNETMNWSKETSNSEYGKSKHLAEMEVWRGIGEGLQAVIVNPSIILGAGDWNKSGSSRLFKSVYNEFPWYTEGVTGFVDVMDVVKAMMLLMESDVSAQRFIVSGGNYTYHQLFDEIANCFGKKPPHKLVTPLIAATVWRMEALKSFFTGSDPLLTKETTLTAQAKVYYNNSKIKQYIPAFEFTPIKKTISRVCSELRQKYHL